MRRVAAQCKLICNEINTENSTVNGVKAATAVPYRAVTCGALLEPVWKHL